MALENDDLSKAPDKADKQPGSSASGVTKVGDEKSPKPMKEKTNLEELDEIELETLLKETITYKSPRDRDCRSSLFNKLLVSAEDSIRKDSALNASGSEAVRHRNPQASRRSRYPNHRTANSSLYSGGHHTALHPGGKLHHLHGGGGGTSGREGNGGHGDGGSIADKGTLGGSLNNLTVEDLYESISQHLQQRPEKSVSARQRTGGSLPCNVNAGLITPCETPLFTTERKSSNNTSNVDIKQTTSPPSFTTTSTSSVPTTNPTTNTTTSYPLPISSSSTSSSSSSIIYGLSSNNTSLDSVSSSGAPAIISSSSVAIDANKHNVSSHFVINNISSSPSSNVSSAASSSSGTTTGSYSSAVAVSGGGKEYCVIDVERADGIEIDTGGGGNSTEGVDMIGIQPNQTKSPASTATSNVPQTVTSPLNHTTTTASTILSSTNTLLDSNPYNIPHIDDDDIIEEQSQQHQYQHKLNPPRDYNDDMEDCGASSTELQPIQRRVGEYVQLKDLKLNELVRAAAEAAAAGKVATASGGGGGPMKIIGQGPTVKSNSTDSSLYRQFLTSTLQSTSTSNSRPTSLEDPAINLPSSSASPTSNIQHLPSLSHHHSAQQPHHQHTGAVRISSLSSPNMFNINHRRMQQERQQENDDGDGGEMVIGVPSTLTGMTVGGDRVGGSESRGAVENFFSERTIHVGDVVDNPNSYRQMDQENPSSSDYTKTYGIAPKKTDDNGNHVTKGRKKAKLNEVFVRADQVEGHRGDIASGDIDKVMAFICGNDDNSSSNNIAKAKTVKSSTIKLQQHRASVSGTNSRTGGKSVDAEHHSHARRHQNHHAQHVPPNHPPNQQTTSQKLHRANSLEEMPTTTLEEFHEKERSQDKQTNNNSNKSANSYKQQQQQLLNNQTLKPVNNPNGDLSKKHNVISDGSSSSVHSCNNTVFAQTPPSEDVSPATGVNNRGRGVLRATKSNAEKCGGSRSGGSANRGGDCSGSSGEGVSLMQPRRSWTNADPSPLQAIQHSTATTASAENLETDFTLVNSKKKKGKKQQQRRNSVGSRTPLNAQSPQTINSPPNATTTTITTNNNSSNQQQPQRIYNNRYSHSMMEYNGNNLLGTEQQQRAIVVNLASLVQSNMATAQANAALAAAAAAAASGSHSDKSNDWSSSDGDSEHSLPIDGCPNGQSNLTSYASITKTSMATQPPPPTMPPLTTLPSSNPPATVTHQQPPKWPITPATVTPHTTTTITATMLTTNSTTSNNNTTMATVVHPENVVVAVQVKVVTNRSQEQQTDDIPPTLLLEATAGGGGGELQSTVGEHLSQQQRVQQIIGETPIETTDTTNNLQPQPLPTSSTEPPSFGDMQRWPSINNNHNLSIPQPHTNPDHYHQQQPEHLDKSNSITSSDKQPSSVATTASWPSLGSANNNNTNNKSVKQLANNNNNIPVVSAADLPNKEEVKFITSSEQTRVVVRSNVKSQQKQHNDLKYGREERIIVKDDRVTVDMHNKVNSARHGGGGKHHHGIQQPLQGGVVVVQNHVVHQQHQQQQNVMHPIVLVPQHPSQIIPIIPITKLPPPTLIDHNTPPPPNFIPHSRLHHIPPPQLNHIQPAQYQQYNQSQQPQIVPPPNNSTQMPEQQNCVVFNPIPLPVNIPDVQMIEHQLQLQHNNNNNNCVQTKNSYNNDGKKQRQVVDFAQQTGRRPAVVIMRGNSSDLNQHNQNSPLGNVNATEEDSSCCELTFGFDVNEELLSLQADYDTVVQEPDAVSVDSVVEEGASTLLPKELTKDVYSIFASRFIMPDVCMVEKEFNYEKIVDFIANAWHEAVTETSTGKCNFYQDL